MDNPKVERLKYLLSSYVSQSLVSLFLNIPLVIELSKIESNPTEIFVYDSFKFID